MTSLKHCFKGINNPNIGIKFPKANRIWKGVLGIFMLLISFNGSAHPFHTSVTELYYNPKEKSWEISVKLFQDDFETTLSSFTNRTFKFSNEKDADKIIEAYLRKHLGVQVNKSLQTPYRYLGFEQQNDAIWVYLEMPTEQDLSGVFLENSLLLDSFEDQTNLVQVAFLEKKKSYLFQKNKTLHQIIW